MFSRHARKKLPALPLLLAGIIIAVVSLCFALPTRTAHAASSHVDVMVLNTDIGPASQRFLTNTITTAEGDGAVALVIEIDTPGGDLTAMKAMTEAELNSTVPVISYVSPTGGFAASAGAFVALAAHIAAMAPTTRIGASSPIDSTGADIGSTLKAKLEHDLVASITGIQNRYHRNANLAAKMVTDAASYDDVTAENQGIVDLGATTLSDLLTKVDGRSVTLNSGRTVTLQTAGISVQMIEPTFFDSLYSFLLDPNVVFLLFIVAMIGIYLEISHPGAILPGTAGAIALVLFLIAIGSLALNWAGLALMVLAFVLLVLDVRLPTHGVLTVGAMISLVFGALLFFNSGGPYSGPQVNPLVVYIMAGVMGLISFTLIALIVRAQRRPVSTGVEGMIGAKAIALTPLLPDGRVRYGGEDWAAVLDDPAASVDANSEVQVVSVEGLRLHVRPVRTLYPGDVDTISHPSLE
ncbi:MAG TPA: nodulation protein NfeD [Ktedonobacteraceae bacterium]|nr:nodulation protein NfeD [Ktedonobacteraceae bacterium]